MSKVAEEVALALGSEMGGDLIAEMVEAIITLHLKSPRDPRNQTPPAVTPAEESTEYHHEMDDLNSKYSWMEDLVTDTEDFDSTQGSLTTE